MSKTLREKRRDIRCGLTASIWTLIKSRKGFWGKLTIELRKKIDKWIRNHHNIIYSPLKSHTVKVVDPFTGELVRKNKLLLQCSVRELYCDLYAPGIGMGDAVIDSEGGHLVSDTMFRAILPPELRLLAGTHKQGCCCEQCTLMANFQAAYNSSKVCIRASLEKVVEKFKIGKLTPRRKDLKALAEAKLVKYKSQAFGSNGALYPKAKDAAYAFQCPSPAGFEDTGITSCKCASGCCCKCGQLPVPDAEKDWVTHLLTIIFSRTYQPVVPVEHFLRVLPAVLFVLRSLWTREAKLERENTWYWIGNHSQSSRSSI